MATQLKRWKSYFETSVFFFLAALSGAVYTHYSRVGSKEEISDLGEASKIHTKGITRSTPKPFAVHYTSPCFDDNQRKCKYVFKGVVDNVEHGVMTGMFMKNIQMILQARKSMNT